MKMVKYRMKKGNGKAFHFYTRNTRNAMEHADNQTFYFLLRIKQL